MGIRTAKAIEILRACATSGTSEVDSTGVDLQGYINPGGREMSFILSAHKVSGTSPTMAVKVQEADSQAGSYTDLLSFTAINDSDLYEQKYAVVHKRWLRVAYTGGGTSPVFNLACIGLGTPRALP